MRFRRNIIRHKVIPMIESHINRSVVPVLARTASVLSEEDAVLDARAQKDLKRVSRQDGENIRLDTEPILRMPAARRRRVLRAAVDEVKGDLRNISSAHIDRVLELIHSGSTGSKIDLHSLEVYRDYDSILLGRNLSSFAPEYEERVIVPGVTEVKEVDLALLSSFINRTDVKLKTPEKDRAYFDFDELLLPLSVRNRRPGDRIAPFGQRKPKKLKKVLIDDKLSRRVRDAAPIIVDGGGVLWMPGGRRSGRAVVTPRTERILCIEARKSSY